MMSEPYRIKLEMGNHAGYPWDAWIYRPGDEGPCHTTFGRTRDEAEENARAWVAMDKQAKPEPEWIEVPA